jgi:rod shape-determining protein MreC
MGFTKKHPIIISLILLFISIQLIPFIYDSEREADPVSRMVMRINYYPYLAINGIKSSLNNTWKDYKSLKSLKQENVKLRNENSILKKNDFEFRELKLQNERFRDLLNFAEEGPYNTISANVIAGSPSLLRTEFLVIDKGKNDGIKEGMPVTTQDGIVGRVYIASKNSSQIMLVTDPISAVDAIVQRTRARGIIKGNTNDCIMEYLENNFEIENGDTIISSGKDGYYPKGIKIGTVRSVKSSGGLYKAVVIPEVSINSLEEVVVITKLKNKNIDE